MVWPTWKVHYLNILLGSVRKGYSLWEPGEASTVDDVVRAFLEEQQQLRVRRRLGVGGFAEVYEAQTSQGVPCAVKVSLKPLDQSPFVKEGT